jgi:hypothetical protein
MPRRSSNPLRSTSIRLESALRTTSEPTPGAPGDEPRRAKLTELPESATSNEPPHHAALGGPAGPRPKPRPRAQRAAPTSPWERTPERTPLRRGGRFAHLSASAGIPKPEPHRASCPARPRSSSTRSRRRANPRAATDNDWSRGPLVVLRDASCTSSGAPRAA